MILHRAAVEEEKNILHFFQAKIGESKGIPENFRVLAGTNDSYFHFFTLQSNKLWLAKTSPAFFHTSLLKTPEDDKFALILSLPWVAMGRGRAADVTFPPSLRPILEKRKVVFFHEAATGGDVDAAEVFVATNEVPHDYLVISTDPHLPLKTFPALATRMNASSKSTWRSESGGSAHAMLLTWRCKQVLK